jgi:hypothetical protein
MLNPIFENPSLYFSPSKPKRRKKASVSLKDRLGSMGMAMSFCCMAQSIVRAMRQGSRVGNFSAGDWTYEPGGNRDDRSGLSGQRDELDLVRLVSRIDMHNGSDIPWLKTFLGQWRRQNNSVMLANHVSTLLERVGRDQSRKLCALIHDPNRSDRG